MINWTNAHLGEYCDFILGGTPKTKESAYWNGDIPWASVVDFEVDKYLWFTEKTITERGLKESNTKLLKVKDIIISARGTVGKTVVCSRPVAFNQSCYALRSKAQELDQDFLFYLIKFKVSELKKKAVGGVFDTIVKDTLNDLEIFLPPSNTQLIIASILSAYDKLIENNTKRIQILEEMAQRIYKEWFVDFKYPGHENDELVDSELGIIPREWKIVTLEEICSRITDGAHRSPKSTDEGYPMASVKDMHNWGINVDTCRKISRTDFKLLEHSDSTMVKNDVLIAKDGSYLKHCFVVENDMDVALLSSIAILRPNEKINSHLLAITLKQPKIKARMAGYVSGAALPRIILKDFRKFKIILAEQEIQILWERTVEPIINNCYRLIDKNVTLRQTRDLLLPKLISGKIDVSDLDIDTSILYD